MQVVPAYGNKLTQQIAQIASTQDGLITVSQLRGLGASGTAICRWHQRGLLHRLHVGVYAVGHTALTVRARRRAALLAIGRGAVLSHWTSAVHQGLQRFEPDSVHVAVPAGRVVSRPGIVVHHLHSLRPGDVTVVDGVRCTTASRTLVDLAARRECRDLRQLCEQAEFLGLLDLPRVAGLIEWMGYPHGSRRLRDTLALTTLGTSRTGSRLERRVLREIVESGLDRPVLQQSFDLPDIGRISVDFYWPEHRLVVEVDGPHHSRPLQRAKDQARDAALAAIGIAVIRITADRFDADPHRQIARVAAAM